MIMNQISAVRIVLLFGLVFLGNACGSIPKAYQGYYKDVQSSATLELKGGEGTFVDESGQQMKSKAFALKYKDLDKGKAGIYVNKNVDNDKILEIYWLSPNTNSRQEEAGLIWYDADIIHTFFDARIEKKEEVTAVELVRCSAGRVMLDPEKERWQVGCPAEVHTYQMGRSEAPKNVSSEEESHELLSDEASELP